MGVFSEVADRFRGQEMGATRQILPGLNDLIMATSKGMDLLEGKPLRSGMKVAVIAGSIARLMNFSRRDVGSVVYAALLHDIGLAKLTSDIYPHLPPGTDEKQLFSAHALINARVIGTPHERPLSPDLAHLLQQHPLAARDFIHQIRLSDDVADIVAAHHELMDGSGYPLGLQGEQIPLGARILAFADVVEGVMADVPPGLTTRRHAVDSFLEIKAPGKFDPEVISVFRQFIDANDDFLRQISTLEVETLLRELLPQRTETMTGALLLDVVRVMGGLSDSMMALYKLGRTSRVADKALQLAQELSIGREQCGELVLAAMLMDIGHLGTPIALLLKPGPLTAEERAVVHDHPLHTQEVLRGLPGFENIALWAIEAHERMNGKGYPGQKKGYEISVGGRILALADVFEALTSRRPYRAHAHEPLDALPVIGQGRMTLYDNQLVTVLRKVVLDADVVIR